MIVFGLWEEGREPEENQGEHANMPEVNPGPFSCEVTAFATALLCRTLTEVKLKSYRRCLQCPNSGAATFGGRGLRWSPPLYYVSLAGGGSSSCTLSIHLLFWGKSWAAMHFGISCVKASIWCSHQILEMMAAFVSRIGMSLQIRTALSQQI